jgi:mannose-6-phosphate isomerase-like protein (cupin superfamily)
MEPQRLSESELIGNPASFQVFRTSLKENYPLHWHEFYELTFIISGTGSHTVNGEDHTLGPGVLYLLTPVDFHQLEPGSGQTLEVFNIIFSGDFLDDKLRQWLFGDQCYRHIQLSDENSQKVLKEYEQIWAARSRSWGRSENENIPYPRAGNIHHCKCNNRSGLRNLKVFGKPARSPP